MYSSVYKAIDLPNSIKQAIYVRKPIGYESEISTLLPPCAIPLWSTLSGTVVCVWRHWFCDRTFVIVRVYNQEKMALEYARTYEQLEALIMLNVLETEVDITPEVENIAKDLSAIDLNDIYSHWQKYGDDRTELFKISQFKEKLPQYAFGNSLDNYDGDFPSSLLFEQENNLGNVCSYELHERFIAGKAQVGIREYINSKESAPSWLKSTQSQLEIFNDLIKKNDLKSAWMCLCSSGWKFKEAKLAACELLKKNDDVLFQIILENWIKQPFDDEVEY